MPAAVRDFCIRAYVALGSRARDSQGQTAAEYVGVLLVVGVIVAVVARSGLGHQITDSLTGLVRDISNGDPPKGR
jgi:Flp pilus assembly pilin Flp